MKKIFLIIAVFLFSATAIAQLPQLFKYQGLARDSIGNPISNDTIALRISIHQGTATGTVVFKETHNPITNEFGSFSINIGGGTVVAGNFSTIPWGSYNYFQEVEMDVTGGINFVSMGTSQYLSVPYSLAADSAAHSLLTNHSLLADSSIRTFHAIKSDSASYSFRSLLADSARKGIAPFWVQNASTGNDTTAVAIIAIANGSAPTIFAFNTNANGSAVSAKSQNATAIEAESNGTQPTLVVENTGSGKAAQFYGEANVIGNLVVSGNVSKGGGSFKIDHPLDPTNKYLYHSFVESPDMKNIYDGTVTTDAIGNATVELPAYFEALNRDFRYQLTAIGQFAQAIISGEIRNNKFSIKTDKPKIKISWQVTGIRKDAFAEKNRIVPEVEKENNEKGKYLYPDAHVPDKKYNK